MIVTTKDLFKHAYGNYALGAVKAFPEMRRFPNLAVAGYPLYDWNYDYFEEVRDDNDRLIGKNVMEHRKGIYAISAGAAHQALSWLDVGLAVNFLKANGQFERRAFRHAKVKCDEHVHHTDVTSRVGIICRRP